MAHTPTNEPSNNPNEQSNLTEKINSHNAHDSKQENDITEMSEKSKIISNTENLAPNYSEQSNDKQNKEDKPQVSNPEINPNKNKQNNTKTVMTDDNSTIEDRLLKKGIITKDQIEIAQKIQNKKLKTQQNVTIPSILVELGFITENLLGQIISNKQSSHTKIDLKSTLLDTSLISQVPKDIATIHRLIPISSKEDSIYIAMSDIYDIVALDKIQRCFKEKKIEPIYIPETTIMDAIDQYYGYEMSIDGILKELDDHDPTDLDGTETSYINPTVRFVDAVIIDSVKKKVSDIHFEPDQDFVRLRYRLDGILLPTKTFHKDYWNSILVRIKIMSSMNIAESRHPQDGSINYPIPGNSIDLRVATHPTIHGENIVLRILDKKQSLTTIDKLGFTKHNESMLTRLLKKPEGIVIVTGPTGSGKTTTLYSILNYINSIEKNIMTLEDPVEYRLPIIRQTQVRPEADFDFSDGVRSIMRQDPDIVFLGEVRDESTANSALRLAMTGHQVFTTLHTNDSISTINRLIDIGIKQHLLAGALICIIAQRLARKLCNKCKTECHPTDIEKKFLQIKEDANITIFKKNGCEDCNHTGYKGRIAIIEILPFNKELDEIILNNLSYKNVLDNANQNGFKRMQTDAILKIINGITDIDEIIRSIDMSERISASNYKIST